MKLRVVTPLALAVVLSVSAQTNTAAPKPAKPAAKPAAAKAAAPAAKPATSMKTAPGTLAPSGPGDEVVMTVGSEKVTAREFDQLIEALPEQYREQARGPMKRQMAEQIIRVKLLAAEARKRGLDKDKNVQARMQFQAENLLAGAAFNDVLQNVKVTDAELQKAYDQHKNEFENVEARHILIRFKGSPVPVREGQEELTEEQALAKAQDLRKQIVGGADFGELAKKHSDDTGSGANGGNLGTFSRGQMVPPFEQAAFSMKEGEVSEPVKTQFGYHVIKVDKHQVKDFAAVKEDLEKRLKPEAAKQEVENLRKLGTVTLSESYFGPEQPAAPGQPEGPGSAPPVPAPAK